MKLKDIINNDRFYPDNLDDIGIEIYFQIFYETGNTVTSQFKLPVFFQVYPSLMYQINEDITI
jgi:hypothetical protein